MTNDNLTNQLLQTFINTLSPSALAAVAADLENSVEDWEFYPEDAPPEDIRQELAQLLEQILKRGREQSPNFDELLDEVMKLAGVLMSKPPFAMKAIMEAVNHGTEMAFEEGCRLEQDLFAITCGTEDFKEGMSAFLEKREAKFKGS